MPLSSVLSCNPNRSTRLSERKKRNHESALRPVELLSSDDEMEGSTNNKVKAKNQDENILYPSIQIEEDDRKMPGRDITRQCVETPVLATPTLRPGGLPSIMPQPRFPLKIRNNVKRKNLTETEKEKKRRRRELLIIKRDVEEREAKKAEKCRKDCERAHRKSKIGQAEIRIESLESRNKILEDLNQELKQKLDSHGKLQQHQLMDVATAAQPPDPELLPRNGDGESEKLIETLEDRINILSDINFRQDVHLDQRHVTINNHNRQLQDVANPAQPPDTDPTIDEQHRTIDEQRITINDLNRQLQDVANAAQPPDPKSLPRIVEGPSELIECVLPHIERPIQDLIDVATRRKGSPIAKVKHATLPSYKLAKMGEHRFFLFHTGAAALPLRKSMLDLYDKHLTDDELKKNVKHNGGKSGTSGTTNWLQTEDTLPASATDAITDEFVNVLGCAIKSTVPAADFRDGLQGGYLETKKSFLQYLHRDQIAMQDGCGCCYSLSMPLSDDGAYLEVYPDLRDFSKQDVEEYQVQGSLIYIPPGYVLIWESDVTHCGCFCGDNQNGEFQCLRLHLTLPPNSWWKGYLHGTNTNSTQSNRNEEFHNYYIRPNGDPFLLPKNFKCVDTFRKHRASINQRRKSNSECDNDHNKVRSKQRENYKPHDC